MTLRKPKMLLAHRITAPLDRPSLRERLVLEVVNTLLGDVGGGSVESYFTESRRSPSRGVRKETRSAVLRADLRAEESAVLDFLSVWYAGGGRSVRAAFGLWEDSLVADACDGRYQDLQKLNASRKPASETRALHLSDIMGGRVRVADVIEVIVESAPSEPVAPYELSEPTSESRRKQEELWRRADEASVTEAALAAAEDDRRECVAAALRAAGWDCFWRPKRGGGVGVTLMSEGPVSAEQAAAVADVAAESGFVLLPHLWMSDGPADGRFRDFCDAPTPLSREEMTRKLART